MADYGDAAGWEKQQMKTFTAWVNMYISRSKDVRGLCLFRSREDVGRASPQACLRTPLTLRALRR
eukprot:COSAG06_NODE_2384_length_6974_cov_117.412655_1_plen_65_part_00